MLSSLSSSPTVPEVPERASRRFARRAVMEFHRLTTASSAAWMVLWLSCEVLAALVGSSSEVLSSRLLLGSDASSARASEFDAMSACCNFIRTLSKLSVVAFCFITALPFSMSARTARDTLSATIFCSSWRYLRTAALESASLRSSFSFLARSRSSSIEDCDDG